MDCTSIFFSGVCSPGGSSDTSGITRVRGSVIFTGVSGDRRTGGSVEVEGLGEDEAAKVLF
jgi:hypothetical protein